MIGAAVAVFVAYALTPQYTATALVTFDPLAVHSVDHALDHQMTDQEISTIDGEVQTLRSDAVIRRALHQTNITLSDIRSQNPFLHGILGSIAEAAPVVSNQIAHQTRLVEELSHRTDIQQRGLSSIVAISVTNDSPDQAARLANAIAQAYLDEQADAKSEAAGRAASVFSTRLDAAVRQLRAAEADVRNVLLRVATDLMASHHEDLRTQATDFNQHLAELSTERHRLFTEESQLAIAMRYASPIEAVTLSQQLSDIQNRLQAIDNATTLALRMLQAYVDDEALSANQANELKSFQAIENSARTVHHDAVETLRSAQSAAVAQMAQARIVSPAMAPHDPSFPSIPMFAAFGLSAGFLFRAGVALTKERLAKGIRSDEALQRETGRPVIAAVPKLTGFGSQAPSDSVLYQPVSPYTKAIRCMQRATEQSRRPGQPLIVLYTSALAREGGTSLALSHALLSAQSGTNTLLVDADIQSARLFDRLCWQVDTPAEDLSDLLASATLDKAAAEKLTLIDPRSGLTVLGNRRPYPEPTQTLLAGHSFAALLAWAGQQFDTIVIDSPPLTTQVDARLLAGFSNVTVLAMRHGTTNLEVVRQALSELEYSAQDSVLIVRTMVPETQH